MIIVTWMISYFCPVGVLIGCLYPGIPAFCHFANALIWYRLVEEYLLFRGFTDTMKSFASEIKADRTCEYQVDKVVETLLRHLTAYKYQVVKYDQNICLNIYVRQ